MMRRRAVRSPRGRSLSAFVMVVSLFAIFLMAAMQKTFVTYLRGQTRRQRTVEGTIASLAKNRRRFAAYLPGAEEELAREGATACSALPAVGGEEAADAARHLWTAFAADVLAASRHPDDPSYSHMIWTRKMLVELSPSAMAGSIRSRPPPAALARVLRTVQKRLTHPEANPPLRVAVVGGSMAEGRGCDLASVEVPEGSTMANPIYCAWPYRFEQLMNSMLGGKKVVEVTNLAEDGTDTAFMTPLLKSWIYPPSLLPQGPDVVVNAYTSKDFRGYGAASLLGTMRDEMAAFFEAVESSSPCGEPPLIVRLDDTGDDAMASIESGRALLVQYGDPIAKVISADEATKEVPVDIDFGMAGHLALSWVLSFALADVTIRHCASSVLEDLQTPDLPPTECQDPSEGGQPCVFAWFAGPMGTVSRPSQIQQYLLPHVFQNTGWQPSTDMSTGFSRKSGLVAIEPGASITFRFPSIQREVRHLNLMTLKSNGDAWVGGKARFALLVKENKVGTGTEEVDGSNSQWQETSFTIDGSHESPTHITYHFGVDLEDNRAKAGSDVELKVELVEGFSFKILGMMLCS